MTRMASPKTLNLDALLSFDLVSDDAPLHTKKISLFGKDWTLVCDVNSYALTAISAGDAAAFTQLLRQMILPEEWVEFSAAMAKLRDFDADKMVEVARVMIEAASERPTTPPSTSSPTPTKRTSARK